MMFRFALALAFSLSLITSAGVSAQTETTTAVAPTTETAPSKSDKKICKRQARTGTRLSSDRVCKTADEWDRYERQNRQDADKMTEMRGDTDMGQ